MALCSKTFMIIKKQKLFSFFYKLPTISMQTRQQYNNRDTTQT